MLTRTPTVLQVEMCASRVDNPDFTAGQRAAYTRALEYLQGSVPGAGQGSTDKNAVAAAEAESGAAAHQWEGVCV